MNDLELIPSERSKISRLILGNARTLMMVFILFVVVVVMTTDIRFITISSIKDLGLDFFILFFTSYLMYICGADGGIESGYNNEKYKAAINRFNELKSCIEDSMLLKINDFCVYYVAEELKKTRMQFLTVACIPYDVYMDKYVKLSKTEIYALTDLTSLQKDAVWKSNRVKPIKLTPKMILTQGKMENTRSPLGLSPGMMKKIVFGTKMLKMGFLTLGMTLIAFDIILEPSWTVFAEVCLKLVTVVINGFDGHKEGFNNITVHTINYVNNQSLLLRQAIQYIETNH